MKHFFKFLSLLVIAPLVLVILLFILAVILLFFLVALPLQILYSLCKGIFIIVIALFRGIRGGLK